MTLAQTKLRQLRDRQSKERGRVAELAVADELTDETRAELDTIETGTPDLERQLRAATTAVETEETEQRDAAATGNKDGLDTEDRERVELRSKVRMGRYVLAAMENRAVDGAEGELNAAVGIGANRFPLELLAPPELRVARTEDRATTGADIQTMPRTWLDRLFAETAAMRLGITMESVPAGSASFPVTTAGASAAQRGKDQAAADTAWTVGVTELTPKRNAATLKFSIEDTARIPGLESALTRDLRMALTEGVDRAMFIGDSGANPNAGDIVGLQGAAITESTLTQSANKIKGPETLAAFTDMIDGIHANTLGDLNVVSAVGAYRLWETTVINSTSTVTTLAKFLRDAGLSWAARGSIEDATSNGDFAAFVGRRMGIDGAGVAAVWDAGILTRDPYTDAAKGTVHLTMTWLWDFGLPRTSSFQRLKFVT